MTSRILLIEDEPGLVVTLSDLLQSEGFEVSAEITANRVCIERWLNPST